MSEKVYAMLLRLHSRRFRDEYGDEAIQLFRDRWRDERGLWGRCRLCWDLAVDLTTSVPLVFGDAAAHAPAGSLCFGLISDAPPRREALFAGGVVSLAILLALPWTMGKGARGYNANAGFGGAMAGTAGKTPSLAGTGKRVEQERMVHAVIETLRENYPDAEAAQRMIEALRTLDWDGMFARVASEQELVELLTTVMRDASGDRYLEMVVSEEAIGPVLAQDNCGFEKVELLERNIGYVKLNVFPSPAFCNGAAASVMEYLNGSEALIVDLRDNRGGEAAMVMKLVAYLFDHPQFIYNPRENTTRASWTTPVPRNKLGDKPVYLLTSSRTASAAEQFAFNLKMLRRAAVVGETTSGNSHAGVFRRIGERFGVTMREAKPINPYGELDWEGMGVEPHVKVDEAQAMDRALRLAWSRLGR